MRENVYICENTNEINNVLERLDKAAIVDLKINDGGVIKDVNNFKGVYNVSQGKFCSAVTPSYTLVQHKEYFKSFAEALDRLNINYKATFKTNGNQAFADFDFIDKNLKFDKLDEEFATGIRLINSYNKSLGVIVAPRYTRLACTNGMILTRSAEVLSFKHTSKEIRNMSGFVEQKINFIISQDEMLRNWVSDSMGDSIEWKAVCSVLEKLIKIRKHREEILKRLDISIVDVTDEKTKKKGITYVTDKDDIKSKKFNRWEIYNAMTHYLTHGEHITPNLESYYHKHAEKLLKTKLIKMPMAEIKI